MFWSQFSAPKHPLLLNEQMAEWAGLAMKGVVDHLWPKEPSPESYFCLVQQFIRAVPHIDAVKRSACIEGAWMALARVKMYWAKMEATDVATRGPSRGQDSPEHYFEKVLEGARLIEAQCLKSIMFE